MIPGIYWDLSRIGDDKGAEVELSEEFASWNEANRRAREEYYSHPGPFYWIYGDDVDREAPEPVDLGVPPQTVRKALETTLDALYEARSTIARQDRLILVLTREIISLESRLGDR